MKPKKLLIKPACFLLVIAALQSCVADKPGVYKNDQIRAGKRNDFHALNDRLFKGLAANDAKQLEGIMSQEFIADNYKYREVELISNQIKESPYKLLDEYYLFNDKRGSHTFKAGDHTITYGASSQEMYLAFFVPKTGQNQFMVTAVYEKYDYGWKLNALDLNPYTENGLNAAGLLKKAKADYAKGYLMDASEDLEGAKVCMRPFWGWRYPIEGDWSQLNSTVTDIVKKKYSYPFTLTQVPTRPQIFSIFAEVKPDGVYPMVYYISKIKLKDTAAIEKENRMIRQALITFVPGIDKNKKYIFFAAYNEWPRSDVSVDRYEITDKLY